MMCKLHRKQNMPDNSEWDAVINNIEDYVSEDEINELEDKTISEIEKQTDGKNVMFGWSGGKDCIVLSELCNKAGIKKSVYGRTKLEYPSFEKWCLDNKPSGCVEHVVDLDLKWLVNNPSMLFPKESKFESRWMDLNQRTIFKETCIRNELDFLIVGHRKIDGNYIDGGNKTKFSHNKYYSRYSPLANWTHEHLFGYIHFHKLKLPEIYSWKHGYYLGTHAWPERKPVINNYDGFMQVYEIDKSIVEKVSEYFEDARNVLVTMEEKL